MSADVPMFRVEPGEKPLPPASHRRGLTDHSGFSDTGCELSPTCLGCTQVICKYDDPNWTGRLNLKERDTRIVMLRQEGMTVKQIAKEVDVSERTAYRVRLDEKRSGGKLAAAQHEDPREHMNEGALMSLAELAEWRPVGRRETDIDDVLGLAS